MGRIISILKLFRRDLIIMLLALKDRETPKSIKGLLVAALLYFLFPVDIVPDAIPILGMADDLIIVPAAVEGLLRMLPERVRREGEAKADHVMHYMPAVLAVATFIIVSWVILVIWGICMLIGALF